MHVISGTGVGADDGGETTIGVGATGVVQHRPSSLHATLLITIPINAMISENLLMRVSFVEKVGDRLVPDSPRY